ncbi:MAG TPA: hypothetical protein VGN12_28815 [Pirellulales bacterium]|jgi:hypothetical protein
MNSSEATMAEHGANRETIRMPIETASPLVVSLGITLLCAGCVTNWALSGLGAALLIGGLARWISQLLPGRGEEEHAWVPIDQRARAIERVDVAIESRPRGFIARMQVPAQVHPYSTGVRGGIVGGAAMAIVALAYGLVSGRGIWYPVNLLAAMLLPSMSEMTGAELEQFDATALVLGLVIHTIVSATSGLFYGILLPTLPRYPVLWGGVIAPLLWTGAIYGFMGVLNPVMNSRVDWPWFIASQVVYGATAGLVVVRSKKVPLRPV